MANSMEYQAGACETTALFVPNIVDWLALVLVIVGGINWGLVGALNFDLVAAIFGTMTAVTKAVYMLVGVAALYCISLLFRMAR